MPNRARSGQEIRWHGCPSPPSPPSTPFSSQSTPPSNSSVTALKLRQPDGGPGRNANTAHPFLLCSRVSTGRRSQEPHAKRSKKGRWSTAKKVAARTATSFADQRKVVWAPSVTSRLGEVTLNPQGSETDRTCSCCLQGSEATQRDDTPPTAQLLVRETWRGVGCRSRFPGDPSRLLGALPIKFPRFGIV